MRLLNQSIAGGRVRIEPPLAFEEAKYFLLGLEADLFSSDPEGYVQSALLPRPSGRNTKQKMCQIFWHNPPPPRLFREGICQLATAARLVLERGWPLEQIEMEPTIKEHGTLAYAVDILIKSPTGQILAAVEVKRSRKELEKLKRDFLHCWALGEHGRDDCHLRQNHPKYQFCIHYRPRYFWAVAPGEEFCFTFASHRNKVDLEQLSTLPTRMVVEKNLRES
ncbi:MAG: hypothetical protein ACR2NX_06315 [Chthoniobacterales bacterium]